MAVPMMGAIQGLAGIAGGLIGGGKRKREQREAQREHDRLKARMEGADTSNLYKNMENVYEDLTINTQAADMQNQANQASLSNTMAGSSRICWRFWYRCFSAVTSGATSANEINQQYLI